MRSYVEHLQALLPPGDLWPRGARAKLTALLAGLAGEFTRIDGRAGDLRREADIRGASELLADFERVLGPDPCGRDRGALSLADRQRIAHQRWTARGGQSRAHFRDLAAKLGERIEIAEYWPSDAGVLQAGGDVVEDGEQFVWAVYLGFVLEYVFNAGEGVAGDPLGRLALSDIECELRRLAPAHTVPVFSYTLLPEPDPTRDASHLVDFTADRMQVRLPSRPFVTAKASELFSITRAGEATYLAADGLLKTAPANELRIDHDPVTGAVRGALIEEESTNHLWPSRGFSGANWAMTTVTREAEGVPAIDGSLSAIRMRETATTSQSHFRSNIFAVETGTEFTVAIDVKPDPNRMSVVLYPFSGGNGAVLRADCNALSASVNPVGTATAEGRVAPLRDGWFRVSLALVFASPITSLRVYTYFAPNGLVGNATYTGDGVSGAVFDNVSIIGGLRDGSRIVTTTGPATRAADQASFTLPAGMHDLTYTFDDGSTRSFLAQSGHHAVQAARPIRTIAAYKGT